MTSETGAPRGEGAIQRAVETAFTVLLIPLSILYIWQTLQVPEPPRNILIGPRTFPMLVGSMMLAVSAVLVWERVRALREAKISAIAQVDAEVVPLEEDETSISDWPAVWIVLASLLAMFIVLETLGFVASFALFIFGIATGFAPARWLSNLIVAGSFAVIFYYLFTAVLGIPLPNGILSFLL